MSPYPEYTLKSQDVYQLTINTLDTFFSLCDRLCRGPRPALYAGDVPRAGQTDHGSRGAYLLARLVTLGIRIKLVLLDRGFYRVRVMRDLITRKLPFIMPAVKRGKKPTTPGGHTGTYALATAKQGCWVVSLPLSSVKLRIKWLLAGLLYYSGVLHVYSKFFYRQRGIILTYHRIINFDKPDEFIQPGMYVRPHTFEKHLYYLKRHYQVITMKELLSWCKNPTKTNRPLCVISFDDGWYDNYTLAMPLLQKYHFSAILFVSTDFIESGRTPWFYEIGNILYHLAKGPYGVEKTLRIEAGTEIPEILWNWFEVPRMLKLHQIDMVLETLKGQSRDELELIGKWLYGVLVAIGQRPLGNGHVMLDWQQVKEMHQGGIEIGSHSLSHVILTRVSRDTVQAEVVESKRRIEAQLQQEVHGFCYPNGDYDEEVEGFVQGAGYHFACTTEVGYIEPHANVYRLKRIGVHEDITFSTPLFACHVTGIL